MAKEINIDALFSDTISNETSTLEENVISEKERKTAISKNNVETIQRSGLDQFGHNIVKSFHDALEYEKELAGDDYDRCQILIGSERAYRACIKDKSVLQSMGNRGAMAVYIINRQCNYLAGIESKGFSYLCQKPNSNSCSALRNVSQSARNDCATCNGSNLWLRVFAASGHSLRCY